MVGFGPNKGNGEESEKFWNDLDVILNREGNGYRLCVLGDLNRFIGDTVKVGITGTLIMEEKYYFCAQRGLCAEHKQL